MAADTIFALSSGRPPAAIAVIRISGPLAHSAGSALAGNLPDARRASVRELRDEHGMMLDRALVLRFDGPESATGEDSVELHCHGGRAVADAVLGALAKLSGLRLARPGEFTRRAFDNGRMDLTEVEGLADLLEAETESQRRAALALAEGGLKRQIDAWRQQVLNLSARAEAAIDYLEDDDSTETTLAADSRLMAAELRQWLDRPPIESLKDGLSIVIAGPPNVGKSSLLNAIAGSEKAIVTPVAGTTRDRIEVPLAIGGLPVVLTDTAGIRETAEPVERIGVQRAEALVTAADILLWLGDPDAAPEHPRSIVVHSRSDLPGRNVVPEGSLAVSSITGDGLRALLSAIATAAADLLPSDDAISLNRRQAGHLAEAEMALSAAAASDDLVLIAEGLRHARTAFDRLTGRAGIEDVLDALFGRFCLGK